MANAVTIPGDAPDKVCRSARRAKTCVVLGVTERNIEASGASLYSSLVLIDAQEKILGKHRYGNRFLFGGAFQFREEL